MGKIKVLNAYCGIGGNRKLWTNVEVTAVEYNPEIAGIYKEYFPNDNVIAADAHEYLLNHYKEFDFIWSSPPCPTHSRLELLNGRKNSRYPDMKLYQEIIFLKQWCKGKFVVENVIPYYEPLIKPTIELERHFFWSNFKIGRIDLKKNDRLHDKITTTTRLYGFDLSRFSIKHRKDQIIKNLVNPDLGLYIFEQAQGVMRQEKINQLDMFQI